MLYHLSSGYNAPGGACLLSVKEPCRFLHPRAFLPQNNRNTAFYALGLGSVLCMRLFMRKYVQPVAHRNAAFCFCRGASHLLESHFAAPAFLMLCRHASSLALFARSISMCTRILFLMLIALAPSFHFVLTIFTYLPLFETMMYPWSTIRSNTF